MNTSVCGYISAKAKRNLVLLIILIFTRITTYAQFISDTFHRIEPDSKLCWQDITDFISGTTDRNRPVKKTQWQPKSRGYGNHRHEQQPALFLPSHKIFIGEQIAKLIAPLK